MDGPVIVEPERTSRWEGLVLGLLCPNFLCDLLSLSVLI